MDLPGVTGGSAVRETGSRDLRGAVRGADRAAAETEVALSRRAVERRGGLERPGGMARTRMREPGGGCEPAELLFVGDNYEQDVLAPQAAGMRAVLLDRAGTSGHPDAIRTLMASLTTSVP